MSKEYDEYLKNHKDAVMRAWLLLTAFTPELIRGNVENDIAWQICFEHDQSKDDPEEYEAYDRYFYGGNQSYVVKQEFDYAWLNHIHKNPHHWQHWLLVEDEPSDEFDRPIKALEMPYNYILEMICDWWSFSLINHKLKEIFEWYDQHKDNIVLAPKTKKSVNDILDRLREAINEHGTEMLDKLYWMESEATKVTAEDDEPGDGEDEVIV